MTESVEQWDIVVIGAGPAGGNAASTAHELGARVLQVECDKMGGTCLNYGCDPTKALLHIAQVAADARRAQRQGLIIPSVTVDWPAVRARVKEVQHAVQGAPDDETAREHKRAEGIEVYDGQARFRSPHEIRVGDRTIRADHFILATGSRSAVPPIDGLQETGYITNIEAQDIPALPDRLAVAGGGPLGVEYAQLFARLGCEVAIIEETDRILPKDEPELADMLADYLRADGVQLRTGHKLVKAERRDGAKCLTLETEDGERSELLVDELLVAIGREAVTDTLDLDLAGVETHDDGSIKVDEHLRTNVPHIYAAGDVLGRPELQFTHVASPMGSLAARNALGAGEDEAFDSEGIPWTTYTDPQVAHLGAMESELREQGRRFDVVTKDLDDMTVPLAMFESRGRVKLLVAPDGKLLGAHILSPSAGDLIAPLALLLRNDLTVDALERTLVPFPSPVGAVRTAATKFEPRAAAVT